MRKAALNDAQFRLLLLQKVSQDADGAVEYKVSFSMKKIDSKAHELDYDLHWQIGRVRGASMSMPVLPLPMTITHAINEWSPLYGVTEEKLQQSNVELIAVLDGTDEFAANTCQVRTIFV